MKLTPEKPSEGVIYITTNLINGKKYETNIHPRRNTKNVG